jgi:enamine deaminase RidA (YjgF/YER057c/UK114 family)
MITRVGGTNRYSDYVIHNNTVYLSGVVPTKDDTLLNQTVEVLNTIEDILSKAGSSKEKILQMFIYLQDETDYNTMNIAFDAWITSGCAPARASLGNIRFPNTMWKIEIVVVAAL